MHSLIYVILFAQMQKHKNIKDMVLGLYHQYGNVGCNRWSPEGQNENRVKNSSLWKVTIPHPKYSGRCFTYRYIFTKTYKAPP